jgi:hypothetical protein
MTIAFDFEFFKAVLAINFVSPLLLGIAIVVGILAFIIGLILAFSRRLVLIRFG